MKILLINPRSFSTKYTLCVGLAYIGTVLKNAGNKVKIVDSNFFINKEPNPYILKFKPDILGVYCSSSNFSSALKIAKFAKEKGSIVVFGGPHVSLIQEEILQNKFIDFGIIGEGEYSFLELVKRINSKKEVGSIPGLIFRDGEKIIKNKHKLIKNLNKLPFPDYSLFGLNRLKIYPISTSRGCPYNCIFCCVPFFMGKSWRTRSPENIVEELIQAKKKYKIKYFEIVDDNFTLDVKRAKKFCRLLISKKIKLKWICGAGIRADKFDEELGMLMKRSGCEKIAFGVESADPKVFKTLNKGESLENIKKAIKICKKWKIVVCGFFIIGLPNSCKESEEKSLKFSEGLDSVTWAVAAPFPHTKLFDLVRKRIIKRPIDMPITGSWDVEPFFETDKLSREEIKRIYIINNLETGNYLIEEKGIFDITKLIFIILKYDFKNLPLHAFRLIKKLYEKTFTAFDRFTSFHNKKYINESS